MSPVFTNWSGGVVAHPAERLIPGTAEELASEVRRIAEAGSSLRVVGAGHSFSPIVATSGSLVSLNAMSGIVSVDAATQRVRFAAGTRLRDIPALLGPHGLALPNQGDVNPQSVAGAVSTGTHGTGLGFTGFAGTVTGLTLVTADGSIRRLSADEEPEIFDLACVAVGSLGVLTEVEMQCVPAFDLVAHETPESFTEVRAAFPELCRESDHVEFYWFPHTDRVMLKTNTRAVPGQAVENDAPARSKIAAMLSEEILDNGAFGFACEVGRRFPQRIPAINDIAARAGTGRSYRAAAHDVFVSPRRVRFSEMEYAIPLESVGEVLAEIDRVIEARGWRIEFPLEIRAAAADDVPLSTACGRESAYIAVHRYHREEWEPYFRTVEQVLRAAGGRPHWGKLHTLRADDFADLYPRFGDFCDLRQRLDPAGVFSTPYVERLFARR